MQKNKAELPILEIPLSTNYWLVRAGAKAEFYEDFKNNNFIAVGSNDIPLESLENINNPYRVTDDILENRYKEIFFDKRFEEYEANNFNENLSNEETAKQITRLKMSSSHEATKVFKFVEKVKNDDIVIVPNEGSSKFLLGIVCGDVFEDEIAHINLDFTEATDSNGNFGYPISNFKKKRRVYWIKEINFSQIPDKLTWIKSTRQTIYNLDDYATLINTLINSKFIYKENFYYKLDVTTQKEISSYEFFNLQKLIVEFASEDYAKKIYQKTNIQSPGSVILQILSDKDNIYTLMLVVGLLLGEADINYSGFKFHFYGVIPWFVNRKHRTILAKEEERKQKLENEKREAELEGIKLNNETTHIENESKKLELEKTRSEISNLGLTDSEVGTLIPPEMQKHNLNLLKNSHEKPAQK